MAGALVAQAGSASPMAPAPQSDAARFAEMMNPVEPLAPAPDITAVTPAIAATPGDSMVNRMNALGGEFREAWSSLHSTVSQPLANLTVADMLRLQVQMLQVAVQVEFVGKAVSKATQNVDQLSKVQ